jgi:O-methyltransferase involved in polyketide biosynthesis
VPSGGDSSGDHVNTNFINNVALRAKKLDEVASGFLARHPDAVGLNLDAGLDTIPAARSVTAGATYESRAVLPYIR